MGCYRFVCVFLTKIKLSSTGACRQMCVVKVNRVESNVLGVSSKDSSQDCSPASSPPPSSLAPEPDASPDGASERLGQWPYSPQTHPGHDESDGRFPLVPERPLGELPLEEDKVVGGDTTESKTDSRLVDANPQTLSSSNDERNEKVETEEPLTKVRKVLDYSFSFSFS